MSGPFDVPDDPDDVTLWAGRLRAWPTPPADSTDTADSDDVDDDTAISSRNAPADDTVRVARDAPADDTVRVPRDAPADDTVRVPRPQPVPAAPEVLDDETVRVSPPAPSRGPVEGGVVDETTIPGRRRGVAPDAEASTDPDDGASTGDTAAGTRRARSRPRVEEPEIPFGDPVPTPRGARIPTADHELYRPRADGAIRVTRTAVPARSTDAPDAAEVRPRDARRTRGRGALLVAAVVLVLAVAAVAVFLLMG